MRRTWGDGNRSYEGGNWLPFNWHSIPTTRTLLFACVGTFLLYFFTGQGQSFVAQWVPFRTDGGLWYLRPWTWFTHPFLEVPSLWYLLSLYLLYSFGGMLERAWGSLNFAVLFCAFSGIAALAFLLPHYLMGQPIVLSGLAIPLATMITAWGAMDPELEVSFWGVPVKAKFFAALSVAMTFFYFGLAYGSPILALFSLAAPAAAWYYVRKLPRLSLSWELPRFGRRGRGGREPLLRMPGDDRPGRRERPPKERAPRERVSGLNPLRRRQEQEEIERLRRLLGEDDDDRPVRH